MEYIGKKCPVCSQKFNDNDDIVVCPKCGAPYHRNCYEKEGKCIFFDLHRNGESWQSEEEDTKNETKTGKKCKFCGHMNDMNAVACEQCGRGFIEYSYQDMYGDDENQSPDFGGFPGFPGMSFQIDLMAGVKPDEDFDGVTGEEISKFVKTNTIYYMDIFKRIKDKGKSRFNFSALLFGGAWMLYRKQYSYGTIFTLIMAVLTIAANFVSVFFAAQIVNEVAGNLLAIYPNGYTIDMFLNELSKQPINQFLIAITPYVLMFIDFVIRLILGFCSNRIYYKYVIKQIKRIKSLQSLDGTMSVDTTESKKKLFDALLERGGTNNSIVICLIVCDMLISFVPQFFIR